MSLRHGATEDKQERQITYGPLLCPCCGKPWLPPKTPHGVAQDQADTEAENTVAAES